MCLVNASSEPPGQTRVILSLPGLLFEALMLLCSPPEELLPQVPLAGMPLFLLQEMVRNSLMNLSVFTVSGSLVLYLPLSLAKYAQMQFFSARQGLYHQATPLASLLLLYYFL